MGKAIKCTACGSFYNGAIYSKCPYCSGGGVKANEVSDAKKGRTVGVFGLLGKKKTSNPDRPAVFAKPAAAEPKEDPAIGVNKEVQDQPTSVPQKTEPLFQEIPQTVPMTPAQPEPPVKNDPVPAISLSQAISRTGRTVGKYISSSGGESIAPVVGWLVGVQGAYHGQSFNLKSGRNKIGRSNEMDVKLLSDESVSRSSVAVIVFDAKAGEFSILPGESDSLCYVNNKAIYERLVLSGYEEIEFGDAGLNKYVFVPFCGERFSWANCNNK